MKGLQQWQQNSNTAREAVSNSNPESEYLTLIKQFFNGFFNDYQEDTTDKSSVDNKSHQRSKKLQPQGSTAANESEEEAKYCIGADMLIWILPGSTGHQPSNTKIHQI